MDLTLIMQNFNAPQEKLFEAVNSVFGQSCNFFNFMFIDDWSTDYEVSNFFDEWRERWTKLGHKGKLDLVKKPQSCYNDPVTHNHGHSFCRNWGLDYAQTEFVMFMDSDDELRSDAIKVLWDNMQLDPEIDISIGNFTRDEIQWIKTKDFIFNSDKSLPLDGRQFSNLQALDILCDPYMIPGHKPAAPSVPFCATWNKIFRKNLFRGVRFPDGRTKDDNFTAHHLLYNARKIIFTTDITYFYRRGGNLADGNLYKTRDIVDAHQDRVDFFEKVFGENLDIISSSNFDEQLLKSKIFYNETIVYLYTQMMYIIANRKDKVERSMDVFLLQVNLEQVKHKLLLYRPDVVKMLVEFIEKEK